MSAPCSLCFACVGTRQPSDVAGYRSPLMKANNEGQVLKNNPEHLRILSTYDKVRSGGKRERGEERTRDFSKE